MCCSQPFAAIVGHARRATIAPGGKAGPGEHGSSFQQSQWLMEHLDVKPGWIGLKQLSKPTFRRTGCRSAFSADGLRYYSLQRRGGKAGLCRWGAKGSDARRNFATATWAAGLRWPQDRRRRGGKLITRDLDSRPGRRSIHHRNWDKMFRTGMDPDGASHRICAAGRRQQCNLSRAGRKAARRARSMINRAPASRIGRPAAKTSS